jgi:glycosyltransferase involved in cell wall biosynthesis
VPLSVGVVSNQFASAQPTGVDRYARELVTALAARDDVYVRLCGPAEPGPRTAGSERPTWLPEGVAVRRVRGPRRAVVAGWWSVGRPRIDRACGPVDVVHVTLPLFPCPTRRPVVYTVHDLFPRQHPEWYTSRARFGVRRALRALERAAAVIAVSAWTAEAVKQLPWVDPERVFVVHEGVSSRFAVRRAHEDVARACQAHGVEPGGFDLFIGQASARKGLDVVVEALARARAPRPFVVAGPPGDATQSLLELAERRGVAGLLRWPGFVSDDELHLLLQGARALLHPSRDEGFGLTPLEAMAAGCATVVADAGAVAETAGPAARLCPPGDPDAWAAAMEALEDPAAVADLAARGRTWVRRYDWVDVASRTVVVYRRALEGG